jgi:hypothetical protein
MQCPPLESIGRAQSGLITGPIGLWAFSILRGSREVGIGWVRLPRSESALFKNQDSKAQLVYPTSESLDLISQYSELICL